MEEQKKLLNVEAFEGAVGHTWKREGKSERIGKDDKAKILALMRTRPSSEKLTKWIDSRSKEFGIALTYADLSEAMDLSGLTVRELFRAVGVEIGWPSETFRVVAKICEVLPQKILEKVRDCVVSTVPSWCWIEEEKPSLKLVEASMRRTVMLRERGDSGRAEDAPLAKRKCNRLIRLKPQGLVDESIRMGISMHWVLNLKPQYCIYGTRAESEEILDGFSFMQPRFRKSFVTALKEIAIEEGVERSWEN